MISEVDKIKATGIRYALQKLTGVTPDMTYYDDYIEIAFTEDQARKIRETIDNKVKQFFMPGKKVLPIEPPKIQIKWGNVILPAAMKYLVPFGVLAFALGLASGKSLPK